MCHIRPEVTYQRIDIDKAVRHLLTVEMPMISLPPLIVIAYDMHAMLPESQKTPVITVKGGGQLHGILLAYGTAAMLHIGNMSPWYAGFC